MCLGSSQAKPSAPSGEDWVLIRLRGWFNWPQKGGKFRLRREHGMYQVIRD